MIMTGGAPVIVCAPSSTAKVPYFFPSTDLGHTSTEKD
jgi:hypothetical protein